MSWSDLSWVNQKICDRTFVQTVRMINVACISSAAARNIASFWLKIAKTKLNVFPIPNENCHTHRHTHREKHTPIHTCQCCKTRSFTRWRFSFVCQKEKPNYFPTFITIITMITMIIGLLSFSFCILRVLHKRQIVCPNVIIILVYTAQISRANVCVCVCECICIRYLYIVFCKNSCQLH